VATHGALPARIPDLQRRDSDSDLRVEHVSRAGAFSGTRQSDVPAGDLPDGAVRCGGGRAPLRANRIPHQHEERDHCFARDLVWHCDLREPVPRYRSGSVGDGGCYRDRAWWIAGAVALAVLEDDSGRQGGFVLRVVCSVGERHFMDGAVVVQSCCVAYMILSVSAAVVDLLLRGGADRVVDY